MNFPDASDMDPEPADKQTQTFLRLQCHLLPIQGRVALGVSRVTSRPAKVLL